MVVAVPTSGLDYYLEDNAGSLRWDSFLAFDLIPASRGHFRASDTTVIAGISGGGYGALKLAFARPELFRAVAAMQPMLEPGLRESEVGGRNRLHHVAGGPPQLIGPTRDAATWEANNPANRAYANEEGIRDSGIAIYIEAAGNDFLNAQDGAEFLHRTLWDLDIPHEYHLFRNADHGGPTMRPRLRTLFTWLAGILAPPVSDPTIEEPAAAWLKSGMQGKPPVGATTSEAFIQFMRERFQSVRTETAKNDPTVARRFGKLP